MKLYMFPVAPNPTRVRLYLAEREAAGAGIEIEEVPVNLPGGEQRSPEHLARNPRGALPVLELPDGSYLTESLAIVEYFEEAFPSPLLYGKTPEERAQTRSRERFTELGVLGPIARIVHATKSPLGLPPDPASEATARALLESTLPTVEGWLADGGPWLLGDRVSMADCTLAAGLQFGRFREVAIDPGFERIARWDAAYRQRPAAKSVLVM